MTGVHNGSLMRNLGIRWKALLTSCAQSGSKEALRRSSRYPTLFYKWQKEFFENGAAAFERQPGSSMEVEYQKEVTALKEKLQRKAEVLSEVTEEMVRLKKELGEI
jgi:transposase-like protein